MQRLRLEHLVRLMISLAIILATVLLGIGERSAVLPLVTLVVVVVSAYVTDFSKWFQLKQSVADCVALGVVIVSAAGAYQSDRQALLVAVANLQSYLEYVLLFQPKTPRVYWQLMLLSLGQVAIASTLVPGPAFGLMLLAYLMVGVVGFSMLLLHDEPARLSRTAHRAGKATIGGSAALRGPMLDGGAVSVDAHMVLLGLLAPTAIVCSLTVVVGSLLFFALPRWNVANFDVVSTEPLRTVGFSTTVLLGELGDVVNNPDVVMHIAFYRGRGSRAFKLEGEPLFRGAVVTQYEGRAWRHAFSRNPIMLPTEPKSTIVRQRITAEPLDVGELFCVFPVFAVDLPDPRLRVDAASNQLIRLDDFRASTLEFEVATTGISGNRQREIVPCEVSVFPLEMRAMKEPPPPDRFTGLYELASRVLAEKNIDSERDPAAAARALSDYFHLSGQFFYSLEPQPRNEQLDPLEDFVTLHRAGHCEYFAGALVLMLRSVGIPARMAIGFKGGEWNPLGMYYQVQQLHAHAWVEVYLPRDRIPAGASAGDESPYGAWLALDPTEGTQEGGAAAHATGLMARFHQSLDYARVLWINYVASLNSKRQRQGIYEPLAAGVDAAVDNLTSKEIWLARFEAIENSPSGKFWRWYRRHWFSWRGGLVAVGFSLLVVGAFFAARFLVRVMLDRGWLGQGRRTQTPPVLEIYRRLETALARVGLAREPTQTAHEFALVAGGELAERVEYRRVAHLPRRIVDSFYRVRFGGRALDNQEAEAVEHALTELELTLPRVAHR
ncbi:MAG: transglutaminaseTgpA domain-containing protein [Pirellulales bacterium]